MRYLEIITEAVTPEQVQEALWWVQRYVVGSLNDPNWDYGETAQLNINTAMPIVARLVGNQHSVGKPLSRYLLVDKNTAQRIVKAKVLPANENIFQSFTAASPKEALEIGREIVGSVGPGMVEIVVTTTPPASDVLFGFADVAASQRKARGAVSELYNIWADNWEHQQEVLVRVSNLPLDKVKVIKKTVEEEDD